MNYVIFDIEATCWEVRGKNQSETIEIGAVKINEKKQMVSEFSSFIQPMKNRVLSDFCKQLTSIRQDDIDDAPFFKEAIQNFKEWIGFGTEEYVLCSWGFYDRKQLEQDCMYVGLDANWLTRHISLKHQYRQFRELQRPIGMKNALELDGFSLEGVHHRGIDDARNISKIFIKYFDRWIIKPQ